MKKVLVLLAVAITLALSACAPGGDVMTPIEARDQTNSVLDGTITAAGAADWVRDRNGSPIPEECTVDGAGGVTFGHGAYARVSGDDPSADAQRVADYWTSLGIETRIVSDPTPSVFGRGGPVNAISFGTAPGYTISLGGVCVPGDPFDYYDDTPTPAPSS